MNKLILCTTGTSIANGCPSLREAQGHLTHWGDKLEKLEQEIGEKLKNPDNDYRIEANRRKLSAELNTLDRLDIEEGDRVVLISTDSAPGRICSEKLLAVIEDVYGIHCEIAKIEGLQVYNPKLLREVGLKNLVKVLLDDYLDNDEIRYAYDIIINPTGGYKAIVPFLTVLGMLYGKSAIYLFEHANELIKLPPLPLTFDLSIYERVKGALKFVDEEIAVSEQAYLGHIENYDSAERDLFLSFTEPYEDGLITLSPLAYILLKVEATAQPCMVSDEVRKTFSEIKGEKQVILKRMINNASNPLWRQQKIHRWPNSKVIAIKPGNTAERLAGFMKESRFHVAFAYASHDDYEKNFGKYSVADLEKMHYSVWESSDDEKNAVINMPTDESKSELLLQNQKMYAEIEKYKSLEQKIEELTQLEKNNSLLEEEVALGKMENEVLEEEKERLIVQYKKISDVLEMKEQESSEVTGQMDLLSRNLENETKQKEKLNIKVEEMRLTLEKKEVKIQALKQKSKTVKKLRQECNTMKSISAEQDEAFEAQEKALSAQIKLLKKSEKVIDKLKKKQKKQKKFLRETGEDNKKLQKKIKKSKAKQIKLQKKYDKVRSLLKAKKKQKKK